MAPRREGSTTSGSRSDWLHTVLTMFAVGCRIAGPAHVGWSVYIGIRPFRTMTLLSAVQFLSQSSEHLLGPNQIVLCLPFEILGMSLGPHDELKPTNVGLDQRHLPFCLDEALAARILEVRKTIGGLHYPIFTQNRCELLGTKLDFWQV